MFDFQSAEFSTVGALLIDGSCLELVRPVLPNGEAFGNPACRKAYEAICALADQGKPIDPVTVGRLSGLDNRFLLECMELSPTCVYAGDHARTVAEGYARRRLRDLGSQLTEQALSTDRDPTELRNQAQSILDALDTPLQLDELARRTGLSASTLMGKLTLLELRGAVRQLPGQVYEKTATPF